MRGDLAHEPKEAVGVSKHGIVRRAWCPALEAEVAIKVVNLDTLVGEGEVDEAFQEKLCTRYSPPKIEVCLKDLCLPRWLLSLPVRWVM